MKSQPVVSATATLFAVVVCATGALLTGCPPANTCSTAADCPDGYQCHNELCTRADDAGQTPADAATDAIVGDRRPVDGATADGARDASVDADRDSGHDAGHDGGHDAGHDAGVDAGACTHVVCDPNEHCVETGAGAVCQCGSAPCTGDASCQLSQGDGSLVDGHVGCCPTGTTYCGSNCIDTSSDNANCGRCFNRCVDSVCINSACVCDSVTRCTTGAPQHTVARCLASDDGGALGIDGGGRSGQCDYSQCSLGYASCDGGAGSCGTQINGNDPSNCGGCGASAVYWRTINASNGSETLPLSSVCLDGVPKCGAQPLCDAGGVCFDPDPGRDAGAFNGNEYCVECYTALALNCPSSNSACCQGACLAPGDATLDQNCGCGPLPTDLPGTDCTPFVLGAVHLPGNDGKVCIDPASGAFATALTLGQGVCGCNAPGSTQCGSYAYDNGGFSTRTFELAGLCSNHVCVTQNTASCGMVDGVTVDTSGYPGATCDPFYGGLLCEDNVSSALDGMGECGCGSWQAANDVSAAESCMVPVHGLHDIDHMVADYCNSAKRCSCGSTTSACDPNSLFPDCCSSVCADLTDNPIHCGTCDTVCLHGSNTLASCVYDPDLQAAQCSCDVADAKLCPTNGGGGGMRCVANKCACQNNGDQPCRIGEYCAAGVIANGFGLGCCTGLERALKNSCTGPFIDSLCGSGWKLCLDSTVSGTPKWACCNLTDSCGSNGTSVVCVP